MARKSLKEILNIPQLGLHFEAQNFQNFVNNRTKANSIMSEAIAKIQGNMIAMINSNNISRETEGFLYGDSDNRATKNGATSIREVLMSHSKDINVTSFVLQLAYMSRYFLEQLEGAEAGEQSIRAEMAYTNGEIVSVDGTNVHISGIENKHRPFEQIRSDLAEGILIANQLVSDEKNKNIGVRGTYTETGSNARKIRLNYSIKDLNEDAKNPRLLRYFTIDKIAELLDKKLLQKSTILKVFAIEGVDKNFAIEMMLRGILTQEELLTKVFRKSNLSAVALEAETSLKSMLLLYGVGRIKIDVLERGAKRFQEESLDLTKEIEAMSPYFDGNINKITELLTHNVLDYENTKRFLDKLEADGKITPENRKYVEKVVSDFKVDQLVNHTENEDIPTGGGGTKVPTNYVPGLTIDPDKRVSYLRSIGAVKKVKIKGETLIQDSAENAGKLNSLDGYELFIIPDKKIAVLEKLYQVTRDKQGNVVYRRNKEGGLIPAVNNATYILPIEMAKELAEKKNKSDLIKSPYVRRAMHTLGWVSNVQAKMQEINPEIEFEAENTRKWNDIVKTNYRKNLEKRELI